MSVTGDGHKLIYRREFFFGGGGIVLFPEKNYASLKGLFDILHQNDEHTITLKQTTGPAN